MLDQRPGIRWRDWAIIALLAIALGLCKSIYILVAGVLIIVLFRRFRQQRAILPLVLAVLGVGILSGLVWLQISSRAVSVQAMFEPHPQYFFTLLERLWMVAIVLVAGLFMMVTFFYPEVSVGNGILGIIQGRYYIPFAPLYFLPFSQQKWSLPENSPAWVVVTFIHFIVLAASIRAMLWRYYNI